LVSELRWILLGLSLPLLAGIWWWTARRSAQQAPGNAELRESTIAAEPRYGEPQDEVVRAAPEPRDWGVPPFEPLNIRTAGFDHVPVLDGPMMVNVDPVAVPGPVMAPAPVMTPMPAAPSLGAPPPPAMTVPAAPVASPPAERPALSSGSVGEHTDRFAAAAVAAPNTAELQRIITIRVCALGDVRWPGAQLMAALELHGLAFGRYQVFHRKHADGRSLFCVASLVEPGTFNIAEMPVQEFRGVTLFAVLPGPIEPVATVDELFETARELAEELSGTVQDGKGMPLSPQHAGAMREDVARFQAALPRN
jgi:cell division protein ZipA